MGNLQASCRIVGLGLALLPLLATAGCTRLFYRNRTDQEVASLLAEKDRFPQWKIRNMYVYPHQGARFADPSPPDRPPMPPDDPGADLLAPRPQRPGKTGIRWQEGQGYLAMLVEWDAENRATKAAADKLDAERIVQTAFRQLETLPTAAPLQEALQQVLPAVRPDVAGVRMRPSLLPPQESRSAKADPVAFAAPTPANERRTVRFRPAAAAQTGEGAVSGFLLPGLGQPAALTPPDDGEESEQQPVPAKPAEPIPTPRELPSPPDVPTPSAVADTGAADIGSYLLRGAAHVRPFLLNVEQGLKLALINSREFQTRREDLYLAALPVTLQRFSFAGQGVALGSAFRGHGGDLTPIPGSFWNVPTQAQVGKLFSTGALLLAQFANQTVVHLGSPLHPQTTSVSTLNLDFIQPLLRGGGKAVTLEPLTTAERNLFYNVRTFARFRKQYFQYFTGGATLPGVGGGTGLSGVSGATGAAQAFGTIGINSGGNVGPNGLSLGGLGASVIPGVFQGNNLPSNPVTPGASGTLFLSFTPSAPAEGVYSTILKTGVLDIALQNVKRLQEGLRLFEGFEQGGDVSKLQVDQVRLQLLQGLSSVLGNAQALRDSLDNIKLQMGLPVTTQLELDVALIKPVMDHMARFETVISDYDATVRELDELELKSKPADLRPGLMRLLQASTLTRSTENLKREVPRLWQELAKQHPAPKALEDRIDELRAERRKLQELKWDLEDRNQPLAPADAQRFRAVERALRLAELEAAVRRYEDAPWLKAANPREGLPIRTAHWRDVRNAFTLLLGEASNERLDLLRPTWPQLPPVVIAGADLANGDIEQAYGAVIQTALENRLDLMNARGQVHDAWRQVAVLANGLLGVFNVGYSLNSSTPPGLGTPLAFRPELTTQSLVFNFQLPIVRIQERNTYRAALIAYQRARRALMEAEDTIANSVREQVRQLQVLAKNFKIQKQNVELAFLQVESSLETFRAPPAPGTQTGNAANAAALTNQVLQSYARVPQVQGQLLNNWVTYITARQQIYLDTELMQIDLQGRWLDPAAVASEPAAR